jgi:osmotically inducible protein OsmC
MAAIQRKATGTWRGDLRSGSGQIDSPSGVLNQTPFSFATRFENKPGTNPEELIAAAHAACFSMAFSNYLSQQGHVPDELVTTATISLEGGEINKMHLDVRGRVPGLEAETFERMSGEIHCPVSNLLDCGLEISIDTTLED